MKSKYAFIWLLLVILACSALPACMVFIVDPLHFFHKALFKRYGFDREQMFSMAAGILDNYVSDPEEMFDAVVVGSSTATGYTNSMLHKSLGWGRTANLSIAGSNPAHSQIILQKVFRIPNVKHVFIDLSYHYGMQDIYTTPQPNIHKDDPMPVYLYDDVALNNTKYLFNANFVYESISILFGLSGKYTLPVENPSYWEDLKEIQDVIYSKSTLDHLIEEKEGLVSSPISDLRLYAEKYTLNPTFSYVDHRLVPVLMEHCNSNIDIVIHFSPRPTEHWRNGEDAASEFYARRYVANIFSECRNIRVYAEDQFEAVVSNPANFLDGVHYTPEVNEFILEKISKDENRLSPDNISLYEAQVIENVNHQAAYLDRLIQERLRQESVPSL